MLHERSVQLRLMIIPYKSQVLVLMLYRKAPDQGYHYSWQHPTPHPTRSTHTKIERKGRDQGIEHQVTYISGRIGQVILMQRSISTLLKI